MKKLFAVLMLLSGSALGYTSSTTQIGVQVAQICPPLCGYIWQDHKDTPEEAKHPQVASYLWSD